MSFTEPLFLFYFLPLALFLHGLLARFTRSAQYPVACRLAIFVLTLAFYGFYQPWWLAPFLLCIGFDFVWSTLLVRTQRPRWRKLILAFSIVQNLGLLAIFKYWEFMVRNLAQLSPGLGSHLPHFFLGTETMPLPPGISFYTFESLSFVIDIYRRELKPPRNPLTFFAFIGMFPRFVAGPIVRFQELAPQFQHYRGMKLERGLLTFALGLFLKCGFADSFASFVPYAFDQTEAIGFWSAWTGVFAFTMQIYFDFAGYSLMAIGLGRCLGFEFPDNFNRPYLATSLADFWRRWHMTLSRWLRDYLFIPLGGSRGSQWKTYRNIFLTMAIGGLWHGSRNTFLVWGVWHGTLLCLEKSTIKWQLPLGIRRSATFLIVMVGWVFFRAEHGLAEAGVILKAMFWPQLAAGFNPEAFTRDTLSTGFALAGVLYCFFFEGRLYALMTAFEEKLGWIRRLTATILMAGSLLLAFSNPKIPFLYFQF